jgi:cytochrome c-type biogenesis protein CcmE
LVSVDPLLFKKQFPEGQKVVVTGLYAGNANMPDVKGLIYADRVYPYMELGYRAVTVKELQDHPVLYFQSPVCIEGNVTQIDLTVDKTDLKIDDGTGTIDVLYRKDLDDLRIDEWVVVEGEFQRNMIYAFSVKTEHVEPTPSPSPSPSPSPTSTPAPPTTPLTTFTPLPVEKEGLPFYVIVIIIAILAVVGIFAAIKLREWLMFRRYG